MLIFNILDLFHNFIRQRYKKTKAEQRMKRESVVTNCVFLLSK